MVEYLLSKYDFYKVISMDSIRITTIQSFNMYGTLNLPSKIAQPLIKVPVIDLPTSLLHIGFKPNSKTTVFMCFDNGWQFSFRIHNAKDSVEPSLKFDVQIIGMPASVNIKYNCYAVVELKVTELKKEHIGQVQTYMNYIDENLKNINQNNTIGIIVCKKDNKFVMHYCNNKNIYQTTYLTVNE